MLNFRVLLRVSIKNVKLNDNLEDGNTFDTIRDERIDAPVSRNLR